jgi:hypothetical protein
LLHPVFHTTSHTVIRFVLVSAKCGTCTVVSVNGTLIEDKMRRFKGECAHFSFSKCPIYTDDGASAKLALTQTKRITVQSLPVVIQQRRLGICLLALPCAPGAGRGSRRCACSRGRAPSARNTSRKRQRTGRRTARGSRRTARGYRRRRR